MVHVQRLQAVFRSFVPLLAAHTPVLSGAGQIAYVDVDDTIRRTYGYAKQGAGIGYSKVKGLNALLATISTPLARPMIAACRLRKGSANSARGAASFVAETVKTARACGATRLFEEPCLEVGDTPSWNRRLGGLEPLVRDAVCLR